MEDPTLALPAFVWWYMAKLRVAFSELCGHFFSLPISSARYCTFVHTAVLSMFSTCSPFFLFLTFPFFSFSSPRSLVCLRAYVCGLHLFRSPLPSLKNLLLCYWCLDYEGWAWDAWLLAGRICFQSDRYCERGCTSNCSECVCLITSYTNLLFFLVVKLLFQQHW